MTSSDDSRRSKPDALNYDMRASLGDALDAWSIVVAHLCSIFAVAVSAQRYEAAAAAFSSIHDFEDHLKMTDAAMLQSFASQPDILTQWKAVYRQLKKVQPLRNKLAHGKLIPIVVEGGGIEWRYLPYFHFYTHKDRDTFLHLTLNDLKKAANEIRSSIGSLSRFGRTIGARQKINAPVRVFESGSSRIVK